MKGDEPVAAPAGFAFSFPNLIRFTGKFLTRGGWSARRVLIVLAYLLVVPVVELVVWTGLLLDWVLYPSFRRTPVRAPVFVIGNFRSGTTFLHRLLAADEARFTTMKMWEILFAPSITLRRLVEGFGWLDRRLGSPLPRFLRWVEGRWQAANVMHEVSLAKPEEDEYLCLHVWSALTIGLSSGLLDEARPYAWFDQSLSAAERSRILRFYHGCVRRHLHAYRGCAQPHLHAPAGPGTSATAQASSLTYLAKNPALTPKVGSILEQFPDCRFVCLVRNPLEAIPSFVSMMKFSWEAVGAPLDMPALREFLMDMAAHWYRYPLERLAELPADRCRFVVYDRLVEDPEREVRALYEALGWEMAPEFAAHLAQEARASDAYESRHDYDLDALGLSRDDILEQFADVYERFGFARSPNINR